MKPFVAFYKDGGDGMGIATSHTSNDAFLRECAEQLAEMIEARLFEGDWEFQLAIWLPQMFELYGALSLRPTDLALGRCIRFTGYVLPQNLCWPRPWQEQSRLDALPPPPGPPEAAAP